MATAYIVSTRRDMEDSLLQVLDLKPNSSQRNLVYDGDGQTSYLSFTAQNDTVVLTGAGPILTVGLYRGLAAYQVDRVENTGGGNLALTAVQANGIAARILGIVVGGTALTLVAINAAINAEGGVAGSDIDGTLGNSTGTVADVLWVVQGHVYRLPAGSQVADGVPNFDATIRGTFASTGDSDARNMKQFELTGALRISWANGVLSKLKAATFSNLNPALVYGAGGTALFVDGNAIPATGIGPAVVVYDVLGNVLP